MHQLHNPSLLLSHNLNPNQVRKTPSANSNLILVPVPAPKAPSPPVPAPAPRPPTPVPTPRPPDGPTILGKQFLLQTLTFPGPKDFVLPVGECIRPLVKTEDATLVDKRFSFDLSAMPEKIQYPFVLYISIKIPNTKQIMDDQDNIFYNRYIASPSS